MNYFIINKIEYIGESVTYTPIGYTTSLDDRNYIYNNYEISFLNWVEQNKSNLESGNISISLFFETTPFTYSINQESTTVEGMGISEININDL